MWNYKLLNMESNLPIFKEKYIYKRDSFESLSTSFLLLRKLFFNFYY